jgi:hypothetical protein
VAAAESNFASPPLATTKRVLALWRTAERRDALVGEKLGETRACDRVVAIADAAFFDELLSDLASIRVAQAPSVCNAWVGLGACCA